MLLKEGGLAPSIEWDRIKAPSLRSWHDEVVTEEFIFPSDDGPKPCGSSSEMARSTVPSHVTRTSSPGANSERLTARAARIRCQNPADAIAIFVNLR